MTTHEMPTRLSPFEVLARAREFFERARSPHAAFTEEVGDGYLRLHIEVGEIIIGALPMDGYTLVRGTASRGGHLLTRFLTTLGHPLDARESTKRHGFQRVGGARVANGQKRIDSDAVVSHQPQAA